MKQIVLSYKSGELKLDDVPAPRCKAGGVVIRTVASLISAGTERGLIELGRKTLVGKAAARPDLVKRVLDKARKEGVVSTFKLAMGRLDEPVALGYSSAGEVVEVGAGVSEFSVGDRVACIGAGFASHGELSYVPRNLCVHLPEGVSFEEGAYGMLGIIALHGVRCARPELGHKVVVLGLGLLGQLAVQELRAAGADVFGLDLDPSKLDLAVELGAAGSGLANADAVARVQEWTGGVGADAVVITAAAHDRGPIDLATDLCAKGGRVVLVGVADVHIDRQRFWEKELSFIVSRASGPGVLDESFEVRGVDYPREFVRWTERRNLAAFLDLVRQRKVTVDRLTTHRFPIERGLDAYDLVQTGSEPFIGVMLGYPERADAHRTVAIAEPMPVPHTGDLRVGVIGAGLFAKAQFLPALAAVKGVRLEVLAAARGIYGAHFGRKFGFQRSTTEHESVLADPGVDAVFVLTRHDQHAQMVLDALKAGKHVFVEKPLCMTEAELDRIVEARAAAPGRVLMVGYNRRFAPMTRECLRFLGERRAPFTVNIRVNAGAVPAEHWAHSAEEGGGRLLSEGCHFFDLAIALTGELPERVFARAATGPGAPNLGDEACVLMQMERGSVVQILYTGAGDRSFSRERVEVFGGGAVATIEDFRSAELCRDNQRRVVKRFSQDLGYEAEIDAFVTGVRQGIEPIPFEEIVASTRATLRAVESIRTGEPVDCRGTR